MDRLFTCHHVVHIGVQNNETAIFYRNKILWGLNSFFMFKLSLDPRNQLHSCWQSKRKLSISTEIWLAFLTDQKHIKPIIFFIKKKLLSRNLI